MKFIEIDTQDYVSFALQTIVQNEGMPVVESIKEKVNGTNCFWGIIAISGLFEDRYNKSC